MENVFEIKYNTKLDRLEIPKKTWINNIYQIIKNHKYISLITTMFVILSTINFYLIYSFVKVLEKF